MYLYTAHRAKSTFHMAKATLTIKNNPQSKRTFPTFSGQGYSYTHAQLREQSDFILHWPSMAIFTLKHNSGSKAYISYRPTKAVHSNKLTEQTDYFLYWPWTATLTLKHNSQSEAYILYLPQMPFLHNTYCQQRVHFILPRTTLVHSYTTHTAKHFSIQVYM